MNDFEKMKKWMEPPKKKDKTYDWKTQTYGPEEWLDFISDTFSMSMVINIPTVFVEDGGIGAITEFMRANAKRAASEIKRLKESANGETGVYDDAKADKMIKSQDSKIKELEKQIKELKKEIEKHDKKNHSKKDR